MTKIDQTDAEDVEDSNISDALSKLTDMLAQIKLKEQQLLNEITVAEEVKEAHESARQLKEAEQEPIPVPKKETSTRRARRERSNNSISSKPKVELTQIPTTLQQNKKTRNKKSC